MTGHEVALCVIIGHDGRDVIRAQCECGWFANTAEVTTFSNLAALVNDHHGRVLTGAVRDV